MGLMEIEMAKTLQKERLAEVEQMRWRRDCRRRARQRRDEERAPAKTGVSAPKVEWPVFSIRIGGFQLVAFRTVKMTPWVPFA